MKTQTKIIHFMAIVGLVAGCSQDDVLEVQTVDPEPNKAQVEVTVPFEANLLGDIISLDFNATDCEGYLIRAIVDANGTATHMGKVSFIFDFCSAGPPDPNVEGSIYTYAGLNGELIAANGDVLKLYYHGGTAIAGRKAEHSDHVDEYWGGAIDVLGGTGRFEGAKGVLTADDYTCTLCDLTHHRFYGEITLIKGRR